MNWFIVVYFLINGSWLEADQLKKEGWSPIVQLDYEFCIQKINDSNERIKKIADYREIELDIKFQCECRENLNNPNEITCHQRKWLQKIYDNLFLIKK